jgi:hypothetical protein
VFSYAKRQREQLEPELIQQITLHLPHEYAQHCRALQVWSQFATHKIVNAFQILENSIKTQQTHRFLNNRICGKVRLWY